MVVVVVVIMVVVVVDCPHLHAKVPTLMRSTTVMPSGIVLKPYRYHPVCTSNMYGTFLYACMKVTSMPTGGANHTMGAHVVVLVVVVVVIVVVVVVHTGLGSEHGVQQ